VYNALDQLVKQSGGPSGTVHYVYDEAGHLLGEYNSTGALIEETIWLGDTPVATLRPGTPIGVFYVHADHLNTPRRITQPSGNQLRWTWEADPFGTAAPNENPASLGTFKYNLRFPGQIYDSHGGLMQNYFRDYDPVIGRYVESDPIGLKGGINTYGYVGANPVMRADPEGLQTPALCLNPANLAACAAAGEITVSEAIRRAATAAAAAAVAGVTAPAAIQAVRDICSSRDKEKNCRALYDTIIRSCASITDPRKRQRCWEAAKRTYEECMAED
jgi:RHS repeat-associated protein